MFCDPLGDVNVWGTLFSLQNETNPEIVLATAKVYIYHETILFAVINLPWFRKGIFFIYRES